MTTGPTEEIPRYFHDYALENERAHRESTERIDLFRSELADRIEGVRSDLGGRLSKVEGELRIIKAISLGIFGTVFVAASKYVIGW